MDQGITLDGGGLSRWRGEHVARRRNKPNKSRYPPLAREHSSGHNN
ncbi:hypothetical protein ACLBR5_09415 [Escherichia coli]